MIVVLLIPLGALVASVCALGICDLINPYGHAMDLAFDCFIVSALLCLLEVFGAVVWASINLDKETK